MIRNVSESPSASVEDRLDRLGQTFDSMSDNDPDASSAFEGMAELMYGSIELIVSNSRVAHVFESKLTSRRMDLSSRIILRNRTGCNSIDSRIFIHSWATTSNKL